MNNSAHRKLKAIVQVEDANQVHDELAFLREDKHRQHLRNLVRMGPDLSHRTLHNDDFKRDQLRFLNARDLSPQELYQKLVELDSE